MMRPIVTDFPDYCAVTFQRNQPLPYSGQSVWYRFSSRTKSITLQYSCSYRMHIAPSPTVYQWYIVILHDPCMTGIIQYTIIGHVKTTIYDVHITI